MATNRSGELTPDGLSKYEDDDLLDTLLVDEVRTLVDIELLYGGLFNLATSDGDAQTARYLTPQEASEWFDDGERVFALDFDLTDEDAPFIGMQPMVYDQSLVPKVAHSWYDAGRGFDHSITHRFKENAHPPTVAVERLTDWATHEAVQSVVKDGEVETAWVIERLAELGRDDAVVNAIEETFDGFDTDGGLMTVRVKLDADGDFLWPSEVDAFIEGMKRLRRDRMKSKNLPQSVAESVGQGICLATDKAGTVYGTSDDPLSMYKTRQFEKFPGHHPSEAWTTHPVSLDAALDMTSASPFLEACRVGTFRGSTYHFPYFPGEVTANKVRDLYYTLVELVRHDKGDERANAPTTTALKSIGDAFRDELRFYSLVVQKPESGPWRFLGEMQNETGFPASDIADAHTSCLNSAWFNGNDPRSFSTGSMSFFDSDGTLEAVSTGWYLKQTLPDREYHRDSSNTDIRPDDPRVEAFRTLLSGQPLNYKTLISWYVERLGGEERGKYSDEDEPGTEFPWWLVAKQFAQLTALADIGLIETPDDVSEPTLNAPDTLTADTQTQTNPTMESDTTADSDDEQSSVERRRAQLREFINSHPPLQDDEKQAAFLLGMLIGQLDGVQRQNVQSTVIDHYPIESITKNNIHRVTKDVLQTNRVYGSKNDKSNSTQLFGDVTHLLSDKMAKAVPSEWSISNDMVQFYYALGIERGQTTSGKAPDEEADATDNERVEASTTE